MILRKHKIVCLFGIFITILILGVFSQSVENGVNIETLEYALDGEDFSKLSANNNYGSVNDILDSKLSEYNLNSYFPQLYYPSLQATYYALYILNKIDRLSVINQSELLTFIMSHYDEGFNTFMDDYSRRYLDIDILKTFYPYTSLLETTCYAILSLDILNRLDLIDIQGSITFIWSCYNPVTSGFIGQPYNYVLPAHFKLSTADNTYFAIETLDLLMVNWNNYLSEKSDLIQYIESLQSTNTFYWYFGGFMNDEDTSLDTVDIFEPNLLSCYYCLKSLEIFDMVEVINVDNFYQYLDGLYDPLTYSFQIAHLILANEFGNIVATSLGLTLSDITYYNSIDRENVISFILNNRNTKGIWNYSTPYLYSELIDTFQVIRSLSDSGVISLLTSNDKDAMANAINQFFMYGGFSLLSEDYTSINLLYTIINSFDLYNRSSELDFLYLYSTIENAYYYQSNPEYQGFIGTTIFDEEVLKYRSFPIEIYCSGTQDNLQEYEKSLRSHEHTYKALNSIEQLSKLDDFGVVYNLNDLLTSITDSQFLETGYSNYGAFLPFLTFSLGTPEYQNIKVFIEYSYYAIKILELLANQLELGNITTLNFDKDALSTYLHNKIFEDQNYVYFNPGYTTIPETLLENTFYMIYILQAINEYDLDEQKIKNFVVAQLDYENIKSVYFAYKISKIITEDISLDFDFIHELIGNIYDYELKEYFFTPQKKKTSQEILFWVAEMVVNDLGTSTTILTIDHLESCKFLSTGNNITFSINSKYSGTYWYWIDGELVDSATFHPHGETFFYPLDGFTDKIKDYNVKINATALDGNYGETTATFSVYSDSSTVINVVSLENCKFLSTGNNITFSIDAEYSGTYWYYIDNILVDIGLFNAYGETFIYSLDDYTDEIKEYSVKINATALDDHYGEVSASFSVYSDSSTLITIYQLEDYEFMSTGNEIIFHINSQYPDWYNFSIDNIEISSGNYYDGQVFQFSIDGYFVGPHNVTIWAIGLDGIEGIVSTTFTVFSNSQTTISVYSVDNYIFGTVGNYVNYSISSLYPDSYQLFIDGILLEQGSYTSNYPILSSIDGYNVGIHTLLIWANGSDGKESSYFIQFSVFSHSFIEIEIVDLSDYEFQTEGNKIYFFINASFPDTVKFYIDGVLNWSGSYIHSGDYFNLSIDGYKVGEHVVLVWANSTDGDEVQVQSSFSVYSLSNTIIVIAQLPDYEFLTTDHSIKFNVSSSYPDYYNIYIDGILIDTHNYISGQYYYYSIDGYGVGNHTVFIWAIGLDDKIGTITAQFDVYSNSTTSININSIPNYIFTSTGNYINFSIASQYLGSYNISIDGILVDSGSYIPGQILLYQFDGYAVGDHFVSIIVKCIDLKIAIYNTTFNVYSNSTTIIFINSLEGCEFMSTGNYLNFSIFSEFPDYYELYIDGILVQTDTFTDGQQILYSLDNYTHILGNHSIQIWAIGIDLETCLIEAEFNVFSSSITLIMIHALEGYEFMSTGNFLNFSISSDYPDYYELWINDILVQSDAFTDDQLILYSLDNYTYTIGNHSVYIWAIGKDRMVGYTYAEFNVYSSSVTIVSIDELEDCQFLSIGNNMTFIIYSVYPNYYKLWIDGSLVQTENYMNGVPIIISLDNYSSNIGNHSIFIWAIGLDGKIGTIVAQFEVYSSFQMMIEIVHLNNYEFMSKGNYVNFTIISDYPNYFEFLIDNDTIYSGYYVSQQLYSFLIDGYDIGIHNITIWANGLDEQTLIMDLTFTVYSLSDITITLVKVDDYEFNSTGNQLQFFITTKYPDHYTLKIDNIILSSGNFSDGQVIAISIDSYNIGTHYVSIWAKGLDGKDTETNTSFSVFIKKGNKEASISKDLNIVLISGILASTFIMVPSIIMLVLYYYKRKYKIKSRSLVGPFEK